MLLLLSPAKTLNEDPFRPPFEPTQPLFPAETQALVDLLKPLKAEKLSYLMDLSDDLAALNAARYARFSLPHTRKNAHPALIMFRGDVYQHIKTASYSREQWDYAQSSVRILSGLYGVLRPYDLIQPHRLEMGTHLVNEKGKNLYRFWDKKITLALNVMLGKLAQPVLVNLASNEYVRAVQREAITAPIIDVTFKENRHGSLKNIGIFAKKARGMMTHFAISHRIDRPDGLKDFAEEGYGFRKDLSSDQEWVFVR